MSVDGEDGVYLVCWPVSYKGHVEPGSVIERCARCNRAVWVAPSSDDIIAEHHPEIVCLGCLSDDEMINMLADAPPEAQVGLEALRAYMAAHRG